MQPFKCPVCEGSGKNKKDECRPCRGEGIVWGPKANDTEPVKMVPYPVPYPQPYPVYPSPPQWPTWPTPRPYWIVSDPVWGTSTYGGKTVSSSTSMPSLESGSVAGVKTEVVL